MRGGVAVYFSNFYTAYHTYMPLSYVCHLGLLNDWWVVNLYKSITTFHIMPEFFFISPQKEGNLACTDCYLCSSVSPIRFLICTWLGKEFNTASVKIHFQVHPTLSGSKSYTVHLSRLYIVYLLVSQALFIEARRHNISLDLKPRELPRI